MPAIYIHGTPGSLSVDKYREVARTISKAVADVRMLELNPEQVTVHLPMDATASVNPKDQRITIEIKNLYRNPLRSQRVLSILRSKVGRAVAKLFPSAPFIECSRIEMCDAEEVTIIRNRRTKTLAK